jgi:FMN-dependent NADH-azoreductase
MTKTLLLTYTPREGSRTRRLVDAFCSAIGGKTELTTLDLADAAPDLLLRENMRLVVKWNSGQRDFDESEQQVRAGHEGLLGQLLEADFVVLAFPIYNFSMPATVKAWIDAVVVMDRTFAIDPARGFVGLCVEKRALALVTSGFDYDTHTGPIQQFATPTLAASLRFMGMEPEFVMASGLDQKPSEVEAILSEASRQIEALVERWY